jgi:hypothetical protein
MNIGKESEYLGENSPPGRSVHQKSRDNVVSACSSEFVGSQ